MKVYSLPKELRATLPEHDYLNDSWKICDRREQEHREAVKQWFIDHGFTGKNTGGILQMPMGDGYAEYMLAEGSKSCLIHLPYGDAWNDPDVEFLPKKEVVKRIKGREEIAKLFGGV